MDGSTRRGSAALALLAAIALGGCTDAPELDDSVRQLQGQAPGVPATEVTALPDTVALASPFSEADAAFLADMQVHHEQALAMTALVAARTDREDLVLLTERMQIGQQGEVGLMEEWLAEHDAVMKRTGGTQHGGSHGGRGADHASMPGMMTDAQMAALEAARGDEFVRLFLAGMTRHHEGALQMVADLMATEGAAGDPRLLQFTSDIDSDQRIEINRMARIAAAMTAR